MPGVKIKDASAEKLDEVVIKKGSDITEALSLIQFYWNLARQSDGTITVEIWKQQPRPNKEP